MKDIEVWRDSGELGRLLAFIEDRAQQAPIGGFALASFETCPQDKIWVCEADWLKQYHEGEMNSYNAHIRFAESRVPLEKYRGNFLLPEYRIENLIEIKRIIWEDMPSWAKPTELKTRHDSEEIRHLEY